MVSTELAARVVLTVFIVGAVRIDGSNATTATASSTKSDPNATITPNRDSLTAKSQPLKLSLKPPSAPEAVSSFEENDGKLGRTLFNSIERPESRLMPNSMESGILLPYDEDFPRPGGGAPEGPRRFSNEIQTNGLPAAVSFPGKPIALRISTGKALSQKIPSDLVSTEKATYYIKNSCFGPRCAQQSQDNSERVVINSPEDWKNVYYGGKDVRSKKNDDHGGRSNLMGAPTNKYEDTPMESASSMNSQLSIPFVVVGEQLPSFSNRNGIAVDRYSRMTSTTSSPLTPEGWIKLKAISPDAYDPFRLTRNHTGGDGVEMQSTFSNRDSSQQGGVNFAKRVGVEINPESFADRWGWGGNHNGEQDNRGGSRLPAWLEDQLKYGNRNSDDGKNWVKLEPIPVAGVSISKWVPKGTPSHELPTTNWQTNRDRPNAGNQWWDRIDDNRILTGNRPTQFLRPNNQGNNRFNDNGGWGAMKTGSSLSSFDRYPTNSWNDIIYPDGPTSATVSWQQNKGVSNYPSSFGGSGGDSNDNDHLSGWSSGGDTRKPVIATGSWSAPPAKNQRFPSYLNRLNDQRISSNNNRFNDQRLSSNPNRFNDRPSASPIQQASENDPRWVLISNSRRVTSASTVNRGNDVLDRNKVHQYINRLHPDHDRRADFPFYDSPHTSHRHGKDFWPFQGSTYSLLSPSKDEAFQRLNATLSTLTPILYRRGETTVRPPVVGTLRPSSPQNPYSYMFDEGGSVSSTDDGDDTLINSLSSTLSPLLSPYVGDGRATSSNAAILQQSSTSTPVKSFLPGKIRQGLKGINPVYAAVGAGMIPATLAAVMPMVLGRRKRRDVTQLLSIPYRINPSTNTRRNFGRVNFRG